MTTTAPAGGPATTRRGTGGPPLWAPAVAYAALTVAGAATYTGVRPGAPASAVLAAQQAAPVLGSVSALVLFASAAPLAVWSAAVFHRLQVLGVRVAGPVIGLVGGVLAAAAIAASGLATATAVAVAPGGDTGVAAALAQFAFLAGGPGFAVASALLLAGVAVPALILRLVPRWLAVAGIVLAGFGVLATLTVAVLAVAPVLPVVRFGGLLWLVAVSVALPRHRHRATTA